MISRIAVLLGVCALAGMIGSGCAIGTRNAKAAHVDSVAAGASDIRYPDAWRMPWVDIYHGQPVPDPYRWMEDLDSVAVKWWVDAENDVTMPYLKGLAGREAIKDRLTELFNYERYNVPIKRNGRYFYSYNPGLLDQDVYYVAENLTTKPQLLIDPNTFRDDGTVSLAGMSISPDASVVAYAKSDGGSDWKDWYFRDVETKEDMDDTLTFIKFSGPSWARDGSGVYYERYPEKADGKGDDTQPVSVYFHRLGTPQSEDELVYDVLGMAEHRGLKPNVGAQATEDGRYVVMHVYAGYFENQIHLLDLENPEAGVRPIIGEWKAKYEYLGNKGSEFYFATTDNAPNMRVVAIDVNEPQLAMREVIPQAPEAIDSISYVGGRLIPSYIKDARSVVKVYSTDGSLVREVDLPGIGTASGFGGEADQTETFYAFMSFNVPRTIYSYNVETGESTLFKEPQVAVDTSKFETTQVFYKSKDGTRIPMFITHKKGITLDGRNPTLLYGYGGFGVSLTPYYSSARMAWLDMGGVMAIPNLRGGGEYGEAWHMAGTKDKKQNVFDDFIAAAQWLIDNGYTSPPRLAIQGGSNGGLLVGACMTQRPDLFGACLPGVGVLDMLRYHTASANARNWSTDYGLSENKEDFGSQIAYSPLHNVRLGTCYPPTLVTTADHDDRVVPWHSFKFAAALQWAQSCDNPVLIRVETRAGHGAGTPIWMTIEEYADKWAFLAHHLGMTVELGQE